MSIDVLREFLLWCTVVNYGVLLVWFLVYVLGHDWLKEVHVRWFHLSAENFAFAHYLSIAIYKIGIILFNLVPLVVLSLIV